MTEFSFRGQVPASKSVYNRALIVRSFFPGLEVEGFSECDDVRAMRAAVTPLIAGAERQRTDSMLRIDCGEAGTVMRFLAFRVAREVGAFFLHGSARLLSRPQKEIFRILPELGVQVTAESDGIRIVSSGWLKPSGILKIHADESSQFASGLLLSAWDLDFDLEFEFDGPQVSKSYWQMSLQFCRDLGMEVIVNEGKVRIPARQRPHRLQVRVEPDYSSAFPLAVAGALWGSSEILNFGQQSLQPDFVFPALLHSCGAGIEPVASGLRFFQTGELRSLRHHLMEMPDLFPALAVLAVFSQGTSVLAGAPQLVAKESNRIARTRALLSAAGVPSTVLSDGLKIEGRGRHFVPAAFQFDTDHDHRMAMAAGLMKIRNPGIEILHPQVVSKSYPEYWQVLSQATGRVFP